MVSVVRLTRCLKHGCALNGETLNITRQQNMLRNMKPRRLCPHTVPLEERAAQPVSLRSVRPTCFDKQTAGGMSCCPDELALLHHLDPSGV